MLRLEGLSKIYGTGDRALTDVSLTVEPGQVIGLIGPSGAGKSTLIRCINRLVEPSAGKISLGDMDITRLSRGGLRQARRRIGMIFQEYALVERLTVMENVLSGRLGYVGFWRSFFRKYPPESVENAYRLLDRVGLSAHVNKRADALSGGQRRRVEIARSLAANPKYLLLDEPFAGVDPIAVGEIRNLVSDLKKRGLGVLITDHNVRETLDIVDRAYILHDGMVLRSGTTQEIVEDENVRRVYLGENFRLS